MSSYITNLALSANESTSSRIPYLSDGNQRPQLLDLLIKSWAETETNQIHVYTTCMKNIYEIYREIQNFISNLYFVSFIQIGPKV